MTTNTNTKTKQQETFNSEGKRSKPIKTRVNKLVFIQYEFADKNQHILTVSDSYRNIIAKVISKFDNQGKETLFIVNDEFGKMIFKANSLEAIKGEFVSKREYFLELAYRKRIEKIKAIKLERENREAIERSKNQVPPLPETKEISQKNSRDNELNKLRQNKAQNKSNEITR